MVVVTVVETAAAGKPTLSKTKTPGENRGFLFISETDRHLFRGTQTHSPPEQVFVCLKSNKKSEQYEIKVEDFYSAGGENFHSARL